MLKNGFWIFILTIVILLVFLPGYSRIQDLARKNFELEERINHLTKRNKNLVIERTLLVEDPEYLEKVAREKMGIAREGEVIFRLKPATEEAEHTVVGFGVE